MQAQLKEGTAKKLRAAVPTLDDDMLAAMKKAPMRMYDPHIIQEPMVYRLTEVIEKPKGHAVVALAYGSKGLPVWLAGHHALRRGKHFHAPSQILLFPSTLYTGIILAQHRRPSKRSPTRNSATA